MYNLQKYKGITSRYTCPGCRRKRCFTLYVDEAGEPLHETVGRCDHESSCGYHYTPKQFFADHPFTSFAGSTGESPRVSSPSPKPKKLCFIPPAFVDRSIRHDRDSDLITFLYTILDPLIVEGLIDQYRIGVTRSGATIFFQIDAQGRCRTGKIMKYDPDTGHRIKDPDVPGRITWVHSLMKQSGSLPADWELTQCLFGEHLLTRHPDMTVALVESEKTAVICAGLMPNYLWLATGGKSCINDRLLVLKGRKIIAFPDIDGFQDWNTRLAKYPDLGITVSPILQQNATAEDLENHIDIADLLIRYKKPSFADPSSSFAGLTGESPRKRCLSFLRAARFIAPEHQDEVEALINDLDLDFWGAEKDEAGEEEPP